MSLRSFAIGLQKCLVARRHELATFLKQRFSGNAVTQGRIAHFNARHLRRFCEQPLIDQLIQNRLTQLRVIHDRGIDAGAELAFVLFKLTTHGIVEFSRADLLLSHRRNHIERRRRLDIR
jgi:hypothetical protein